MILEKVREILTAFGEDPAQAITIVIGWHGGRIVYREGSQRFAVPKGGSL